jgi:hypothetical protein
MNEINKQGHLFLKKIQLSVPIIIYQNKQVYLWMMLIVLANKAKFCCVVGKLK